MTELQLNTLIDLYEPYGRLKMNTKTEKILRELQEQGLTLIRGSRWCATHKGALVVKIARGEL